MATAKELAMLAEAVRQLAKTDPEIRSAIEAAALRGDIPETEVRADIADSQDECCAEEGNGGGGPDGPCETPAGSIWCQPDEPWTNCETGEPIRIWPGGFPQTESCKECQPDEDWEQGTYWRGLWSGRLSRGPIKDSVALDIATQWAEASRSEPRHINLAVSVAGYRPIPNSDDGFYVDATATYYDTWIEENGSITTAGSTQIRIYRTICESSDIQNERYGCELTEAPDKCGEEWDEDSVADLAIIDGCITGSKCDPDATSADQKCKTCQDMCQGARRIRVCAKPHTGGFTAEDPNNPGYGSSYDRFGNKLYDYNPLG